MHSRKTRLAVAVIASCVLLTFSLVSRAADEESLAALLAEASKNRRYAPPTAKELKQAEDLFAETLKAAANQANVDLLYGHGDAPGRESPNLYKDLRSRWAALGWQLSALSQDGPWLIVHESKHDPRGRGFFAFRRAAAEPIALQAPHSFYDLHTRPITLRLFKEGPFAAAAWNTVHRKTVDAAHEANHYLNAFTRAFVTVRPKGAIVQLHGFSQAKRRDRAAAESNVIVSNGTRFPGRLARITAMALKANFDQAVSLYPNDVRELGATTNVQASIVHAMGHDSFLHIELSRQLRNSLLREHERYEELLYGHGDSTGRDLSYGVGDSPGRESPSPYKNSPSPYKNSPILYKNLIKSLSLPLRF